MRRRQLAHLYNESGRISNKLKFRQRNTNNFMKVRAGTAILIFTAGLDCLTAQNTSPMSFYSNNVRDSQLAMVRKYTAALSMDTQRPINMDGFYKITSTQLDSLALLLETEVSSRYQQKCLEILKSWAFEDNGVATFGEETAEADLERAKGLSAVKWLRIKAREIRYKYRTTNKLSILPVRNATDAEMYHGPGNDSNNIGMRNMRLGMQSVTGQYTFYTDVYNDYFGAVAMGVGTLLGVGKSQGDNEAAAQSENQEASAVNRLLFGGGNVVIHASYPLLYWNKSDQNFDFRVRLQPRLGFDLPELGTQTTSYAMNLDMGIYSTLRYTGLKENIGVIVEFKSSAITGNKEFYYNLGTVEEKLILLNQLSIGLKLGKTFQITWMNYWGNEFKKPASSSLLSLSMGF